jgi:multiple sugar transport system permease protein
MKGSRKLQLEGARSVRWGVNFVLLSYSVLIVIPFLWLLAAPSKDGAQQATLNPLAFGSFRNYWQATQAIFHTQNGMLSLWLRNSVITTLAALFIGVSASVLAGFVLTLVHRTLKRVVLFLTLVLMILPWAAMALPIYVLMDKLHLTDSLLEIVLVGSFYPFGTFLAFLYFSTVMPTDLIDMARIDGLGDFRIFLKLGLPLSRSLWGIMIFFSFLNLWNSYQVPRILLNSPENFTLPVGLHLIFGNGNALIGLFMVIPSLIIFAFAQRAIERGIFSGAVKA